MSDIIEAPGIINVIPSDDISEIEPPDIIDVVGGSSSSEPTAPSVIDVVSGDGSGSTVPEVPVTETIEDSV